MSELNLMHPTGLRLGGRLSFLLKNSVVYGGAAAISKAFALITFPLLARHMSVEQYGLLDYMMVLAGFLAILFVFGQDSAVGRYFYEHEDPAERAQVITQSLLFQLATAAIGLPVLWIASTSVSQHLAPGQQTPELFRLVLLQVPFLVLINFAQNLLKWTFSRTRFLVMSLGFTAVQVSLLLVAIVVYDAGIAGVLRTTLASVSIFAVLGMVFVRQWLVKPRGFERLREMLPFAIPYGIICVLAAGSPALERMLTQRTLGPQELGLYAAGVKIAMLAALVSSAFQTSWGPFSLSLHKQANAIDTYNWVLRLVAAAMCVFVLLLTMASTFLLDLLATNRYAGAAAVVFPLAMALAVQATGSIVEIGIGFSKRSYLSLYTYSAWLALTAAGILFFSARFGLTGVALGVLAGHVGRAFLAGWLAQRACPMRWQYAPVVMLMAATAALGLASEMARAWLPDARYFALLGAATLCVCLAAWSWLLTPAHRDRVRASLSARLHGRRSA